MTAVQIASDLSGIREVLNRSGYDGYDEESVRRRVVNVRNWLTSYAPDSAKFEVQETLPDAVKNLSGEQRAGLVELASRIQGGVAAKDLHDLMYAVSEIRYLCEQDVPGDLHIATWEEIGSESWIFYGVSGPGVFAGQAAGGWRREGGILDNMHGTQEINRILSKFLYE